MAFWQQLVRLCLGLEGEWEENVLIASQPWKPHPLAVGSPETVRVSICMCQCDSKCAFHAAALGASVHLNPVGGEVGVGIARRSGGGCWDLLGSLSFLLREQLRFPAGDGWPGLRGGCPGRSLLLTLSAETDAAAGALSPCTIPAPPQPPLLPLPTRSVTSTAQGNFLGGREGLASLETCQ